MSCPYIGHPRSIGYCFKCDYKKGISNYDLVCDYRDATKKLKEMKKLEKKNKEENLNEESIKDNKNKRKKQNEGDE